MEIQNLSPAQRLTAKLTKQIEEREALKMLWDSVIHPEINPENRQWNFWLNKFGFDIVHTAIERMAVKFSKECQEAIEKQDEALLMGMLDCIRYASKTMNLIKADLDAALEKKKGESRG